MPNWVKNIIEADNGTLSKIKAECTREDENGNIVFDFNSVVPMPESMNEVEAGGYTEDGLAIVLDETMWKDITKFKYISEAFMALFSRNLTAKLMFSEAFKNLQEADDIASRLRKAGEYDEAVSLGRKAIENVLSFGNVCWYDWAVEHWGTKWNAYSTDWEDGYIGFDTAWEEPSKVVAELSKKYPSAIFKHLFANEDLGCGTGFVIYKGGEVMFRFEPADYSEATKFAEKIWNR